MQSNMEGVKVKRQQRMEWLEVDWPLEPKPKKRAKVFWWIMENKKMKQFVN